MLVTTPSNGVAIHTSVIAQASSSLSMRPARQSTLASLWRRAISARYGVKQSAASHAAVAVGRHADAQPGATGEHPTLYLAGGDHEPVTR